MVKKSLCLKEGLQLQSVEWVKIVHCIANLQGSAFVCFDDVQISPGLVCYS